jgi:hypothetical protein
VPTAWPNFSVSILMCFSAAGLFLHVARSACREGKLAGVADFSNGGNFAGRGLRLLVLHMTSMSNRCHRLKRSGWRCHTGTHVQGCPIRSIQGSKSLLAVVAGSRHASSWVSWCSFRFGGSSVYAGTDIICPTEQFIFHHAIQDPIF